MKQKSGSWNINNSCFLFVCGDEGLWMFKSVCIFLGWRVPNINDCTLKHKRDLLCPGRRKGIGWGIEGEEIRSGGGWLGSYLALWAQPTLGLKETFIKRYIVERTYEIEVRPAGRTEWENGMLSGEFMEWNAVERAKTTELDTRTEWKGASSVSVCQTHKP